MTLTATAGSASANSYCTLAEAETYFGNSYGRAVWTSASDANKNIVLIEATRLLDTLVKWQGYLATATQALRWPRTYVRDPDSYPGSTAFMDIGLGGPYLDSTTVPQPIKEIACELAYSILSNGGFSAVENDVTKVRVGTIIVDFSEKVKGQGFPQIVRDMITRWGEYMIGSSNSVHSVTISRV